MKIFCWKCGADANLRSSLDMVCNCDSDRQDIGSLMIERCDEDEFDVIDIFPRNYLVLHKNANNCFFLDREEEFLVPSYYSLNFDE